MKAVTERRVYGREKEGIFEGSGFFPVGKEEDGLRDLLSQGREP